MITTYYAVGWCQHDHPPTVTIPTMTLEDIPVTDVIFTGKSHIPLPEALMHVWHHAQHRPVTQAVLYEAIAAVGGPVDASDLTELLSLEVFVEWSPLLAYHRYTTPYRWGLSHNATIEPLHEIIKNLLAFDSSRTYQEVLHQLILSQIPELLDNDLSSHLMAVPWTPYFQAMLREAEAR